MSDNDLWICSADGKSKLAYRCVQSVVTAYEVRWLASIQLGVDPSAIDVKLIKNTDLPAAGDKAIDKAIPDWRGLQSTCRNPAVQSLLESATFVEVRWTGSDYNHGGGSANRRRLQVRSPGTEEWTDA